MKHFFLYLIFFLPLGVFSQVITVSPAFPTVNDTVTIVYDAAQGNAALVGVSPIYVHTGVITNFSTSATDWQHVQMLPWVTNDPKLLMTNLGNNKHRIKFHMKSFYGVTNPTEIVQKMAFVFRNTTGTIVGKDAAGQDIYYDVYSGANLQLSISTPLSGTIYNLNDAITITANASANADLSLAINGTSVQTAPNSMQITYNTTGSTAGLFTVVASAPAATSDSAYYIVHDQTPIQNPPTGTVGGVQYLTGTSVRICLRTPHPDVSYVYVIGDMNNWLPHPDFEMKSSTDGKMWWIDIPNIVAGQEYGYQFLVKKQNGTVLTLADPYSEKLLDPWNDSYIPSALYPNLKPYPIGKTTGMVSVFQTNQTPYNWTVSNFTKPSTSDLVIYELLIRDFTKRHAYQAVIDTLWYLKDMGVNAIELMPVMEFDGNNSWGYGPNFQMAPDKYYGTREKLKELIDKCHQNGIAVIFDIALNHQFGLSPMVQLYWDATNNKPSSTNPWFNPDATHPYNVGYDMNHDSPETRAYVDRVLKFWIETYKVDGFRFDLSKGFTQVNSGTNVGLWGNYDASRIYNLKRMGDAIKQYAPTALLILEHFADGSEEKELADYGFMTWGNNNCSYNQATMGYSSGPNCDWNFQGISYKARNYNQPHLVGYMESHDEERLMFKNLQYGNVSGTYNIKNLNTSLNRMGQAAAFFLTVPGPKMIWQFGEVGYDISIDDPCRICEKPVKWDYFTVNARRKLYNIYSAITKLRINEPAFETNDFSLNVGNAFKQIQLNHSSMNVNIIGNFDVVSYTGNISFQSSGKWYDYLTGDSITIASTSPSLTLQAGEYHIYTSKKLTPPNLTTSIDADFLNNFHHTVFPNPSKESIRFVFSLPESGSTQIRVLNLAGQVVAIPLEEAEMQGNELIEIKWDRNTPSGMRLPSGTYFYQIIHEGNIANGRFVLE